MSLSTSPRVVFLCDSLKQLLVIKRFFHTAAHISEMDVFGIEVSKSYSMGDWREDLKTVLRMAGAQGKPTVFLFGV